MQNIFKIGVSVFLISSVSSIAFGQSKKMSDIFSYDMIGSDVTYLESLIGPARKTDETFKTKTYIVDSCELQVGYDRLNITTLSVETGEKCNFVLKDVISFQKNVPTNQLAFGLSGPVSYYSDCLTGCGNAYDPEIYELYTGSHAENWREILISSINASAGQWREKMMAEQGGEWVMENRFNCDPQKYNDIAAKSMQGQRAERIMIGYGLKEKAQLQRGCDEPFENMPIAEATETNQGIEKLTEVPFQEVYRARNDYFYYVGSQIVVGELLYEPNEMDGYQFEFVVRSDEEHKLPSKAKGYRFVLNDYSNMNAEKLTRASEYLGIKTDLTDPKFEANNCAVTGPITLQITNISLDIPESAQPFPGMESFKVIQAGPFRMGCEEI